MKRKYSQDKNSKQADSLIILILQYLYPMVVAYGCLLAILTFAFLLDVFVFDHMASLLTLRIVIPFWFVFIVLHVTAKIQLNPKLATKKLLTSISLLDLIKILIDKSIK